MKRLFRNNYVELSLAKALVVGVGKGDDTYALFLGCLIIEIKPWAFNRKPRPTSFNEVSW